MSFPRLIVDRPSASCLKISGGSPLCLAVAGTWARVASEGEAAIASRKIIARTAIWLIALVLGVGAGVESAWLMTGKTGDSAQIHNGQWETPAKIGDTGADPYMRASVARTGIWALPPSEVIYYSTHKDSEGKALSNRCRYQVTGGDLPTRWWSITLYRNNFWVPNPADRYSVAKTNIKLEPDGTWIINVNPTGEGVNAIPMGNQAGDFDLSLRFYHPAANVAAERGTIALPVVRRLSCA
ncbi:MAG: DUF1214 domain-containing protein [Alphaproteobacteria bacterium]